MDMEFSEGGNEFRIAGPQLFEALVGPPVIEVITDLCVAGQFLRVCEGTTYGPITLLPGEQIGGVVFDNPTDWVSVVHRIRVTNNVNLDLNNRAPLATGAVPEPGTWALMGSGILLLALRRRR